MPGLPGVIDEKELAQIAKRELNEDPNRTKDDIKAIQSWIKKQPHLHKSINTGKNTFHIQYGVIEPKISF